MQNHFNDRDRKRGIQDCFYGSFKEEQNNIECNKDKFF